MHVVLLEEREGCSVLTNAAIIILLLCLEQIVLPRVNYNDHACSE